MVSNYYYDNNSASVAADIYLLTRSQERLLSMFRYKDIVMANITKVDYVCIIQNPFSLSCLVYYN